MTVRLMYTFVIALIVSACGGGGGGGNNGGGNPPAVPPTALEGTWLKPCGIAVGEDTSNPKAVHNIITITVRDKVIDTSIENYIDDACTVQDANISPPVATSNATLVIGNDVTTTMNQTATEVDTLVQSSTGATFTDTYNIFTISNSNILYLGAFVDPKDGSEPAKRSDTIDFDRAYFLQ